MTTFLPDEESAKAMALISIKGLTKAVFEQKPEKVTIDQFGFKTKAKKETQVLMDVATKVRK
jgi:hypothetical protein